MAKHTKCHVCWRPDVLTTGIDRCDHCTQDQQKMQRTYNVLIARYPKLKEYTLADLFQRLAEKVLTGKR